jgi:hypothetical protein
MAADKNLGEFADTTEENNDSLIRTRGSKPISLIMKVFIFGRKIGHDVELIIYYTAILIQLFLYSYES